MYCIMLSMDRDLEGRRWLHVEVGRQESYQRYDNIYILDECKGPGARTVYKKTLVIN